MTRIKIREKVVVKVDFLFIVDDRGLALRVFSYSIFTEWTGNFSYLYL